MSWFDLSEHKGLPLIILGIVIFIWAARRMKKKSAEAQRRITKTRRKKDWL